MKKIIMICALLLYISACTAQKLEESEQVEEVLSEEVLDKQITLDFSGELLDVFEVDNYIYTMYLDEDKSMGVNTGSDQKLWVALYNKTTGEVEGSINHPVEDTVPEIYHRVYDNLFKYSIDNQVLVYFDLTSDGYLVLFESYSENLASELEGVLYNSFDGTPELQESEPNRAWWVISNENGIYGYPLEGNSNQSFSISSSLIYDELNLEVIDDSKGAYFDDLRLMNNGGTLVATVVYPFAQSGNIAILTYDIASGESHWHQDVFSAMIAEVDYIDDDTIYARGFDTITDIDLTTHQALERSAYDFTKHATYDYENYFYMIRTEEESQLYVINDESENLIYSINQLSAHIVSVSENYVYVQVSDTEIVAVQY